MDNRKILRTYMALASLFFFSACAQVPKNYRSPKGYDLNRAERTILPYVLHELSGISFSQENNDFIFANEDENGKVYFFPPGNPVWREVQFGKAGDYEGIAISNGYVVVLESQGTIHTFPYADVHRGKTSELKIAEDLIPNGNYESLAASSADSLLYVLCKKCGVDKGATSTTGYVLGLSRDGEVSKKGEFKIDEGQIGRFSSLRGKSFRPSALTKNTRTNEWYMLSSVNKMLVTANGKWEITGAYPLDPSLFNQPEAIAFDLNGNLYIGNEGGDKTRNATLLKFDLIP
ncbi:MAG TPA: SdiA-regulated domain-containing protein [Arenibacter sp.]|nr:SdiA-regulated domain-containing protein [Arenibacter sp.]